jgi:hypothetical protein
MKQLQFLFYICIGSFTMSCHIQKPHFSTPANEINDVALFRPKTFIEKIEVKNLAKLDDSTSDELMYELVDCFESMSKVNSFRLNKIDANQQENLDADMVKLYRDLLEANILRRRNQPINLNAFKAPISVVEALKNENQRYGMYVFCDGIYRTKKLYRKQLTKNILIGLSTGLATGMASNWQGIDPMIISQQKSFVKMGVMIIDASEQKVVFFNLNEGNADIENKNEVLSQFKRLFVGYYYDEVNIPKTPIKME